MENQTTKRYRNVEEAFMEIYRKLFRGECYSTENLLFTEHGKIKINGLRNQTSLIITMEVIPDDIEREDN